MKKIIFAFMAMVAVTFAACGNQTKNGAAQNDSDTVVVNDSLSADSIEVVDSNAVK